MGKLTQEEKRDYKEKYDNLGTQVFSSVSGQLLTYCENDEIYTLDCTGVTHHNNKCSIEIKIRNMSSNTPMLEKDGAFIEDDKMSTLCVRAWYRKHIPLYVNFFDRCETMVVWRMDKLPQEPKHSLVRINSKDDKGNPIYGEVTEGRWLLPLSWGIMFKKIDGEWIRVK